MAPAMRLPATLDHAIGTLERCSRIAPPRFEKRGVIAALLTMKSRADVVPMQQCLRMRLEE
jgi:hypothetical protein